MKTIKIIFVFIFTLLLCSCEENNVPMCFVESSKDNLYQFDHNCFYEETELEVSWAIEYEIDKTKNLTRFYYEDLFYDAGYYNLRLDEYSNYYSLNYDTAERNDHFCIVYKSKTKYENTCMGDEIMMIESMIELQQMFLDFYNQAK